MQSQTKEISVRLPQVGGVSPAGMLVELRNGHIVVSFTDTRRVDRFAFLSFAEYRDASGLALEQVVRSTICQSRRKDWADRLAAGNVCGERAAMAKAVAFIAERVAEGSECCQQYQKALAEQLYLVYKAKERNKTLLAA